MRVFISSVRKGLEDERDALPGIITAIGHSPVRFEDFGAQSVPSREACLTGLASADIYLLILGPKYGHRFEDTGQSPTHDEWRAAVAAGLPRLVYRKTGVHFEDEQMELVRSIGDYSSGVFYDSFETTSELLTKVVGRIRELEQAPKPLAFAPLTHEVPLEWREQFDSPLQRGGNTSPAALEVHVVPVGAAARSARVMSDLAESLANRIRETRFVDSSSPLEISRPAGAIVVSIPPRRYHWDAIQEPQLLGVRLSTNGQLSAWASLPSDRMGPVLDDTELPGQTAGLLRLLGQLRVVESTQVAIGIGVHITANMSIDRVARFPRSQMIPLAWPSERSVCVPPDELASLAALDRGATEVGHSLSRTLIESTQAAR